jgi:hypothetical protein
MENFAIWLGKRAVIYLALGFVILPALKAAEGKQFLPLEVPFWLPMLVYESVTMLKQVDFGYFVYGPPIGYEDPYRRVVYQRYYRD